LGYGLQYIEIVLTTTIGKGCKYNGWERLGGVTTTDGIPIVGVNYNDLEVAR